MYAESSVSQLVIQRGSRARLVSYIEVTLKAVLDDKGAPQMGLEITNLSEDILETLRDRGVLWISPSEHEHGLHNGTVARAVAVIKPHFVIGTVKNKHNRPGATKGNTVQLYTIIDGKWDECVFEGVIDSIRGDGIVTPRFIPSARKKAEHADTLLA